MVLDWPIPDSNGEGVRVNWELAVNCRVCGGQYFAGATGTDRCENCEWCTGCDKRNPNTASQCFDDFCSLACNVAYYAREQAEADRKRAASAITRVYRDARRNELFERDGWICYLCAKPVDREAIYPHSLSAVLDHVIPRAKGGHSGNENLRTAHALCNNQKNDIDLDVFLALK